MPAWPVDSHSHTKAANKKSSKNRIIITNIYIEFTSMAKAKKAFIHPYLGKWLFRTLCIYNIYTCIGIFADESCIFSR
jgi:hypothetical protein